MFVWCSPAAVWASRRKRSRWLGPSAGADRQHLEGDPLAQRQVDGLVDDAHAAAADLALDAIVVEELTGGERGRQDVAGPVRQRGGRAIDRLGLTPRHAFEKEQRRKEGADALAEGGVAAGVVFDVGQFPGPHLGGELFGELSQDGGGVGHVQPPGERRGVSPTWSVLSEPATSG